MANKELEYTSGPWVQNGMNGIHTTSGSPIAIADGENRLANAQLISAAPDLLQALQNCHRIMNNMADQLSEVGLQYMDQAEQAIQKALTL